MAGTICPARSSASRLIVDQMPGFGAAERVKLRVCPGGHMFYSRLDSGAALKRDARAVYGAGGQRKATDG